MTFPNSTPTAEKNGRVRTKADEAAERYATQFPRPVRPKHAPIRQYVITALAAFVLGAVMVGTLSWVTMPIVATEVERVFVDVDGDGVLDFLVSGYVVYAPKGQGQ